MNKKFKKIISSFLIFIVFLTPFLSITPRQASAQFGIPTPTFEIPGPLLGATIATAVSSGIDAGANSVNTLKETVGDGFAYYAMNLVIERIAASTINWINSGFKGSPGYITDPQGYFTDLGDKVAGEFIMTDPRLSQLCGPISAQVRIALTNNYVGDRQWQCTLTDMYGNVTDFMDDFSKGGWDKFFQVSQQAQNNPIGAYLQAQNELSIQLNSAQQTSQMTLSWGRGFLSKKECAHWGTLQSSDTNETPLGTVTGAGFDENGIPLNVLPDSPDTPTGGSGTPYCLEERIVTPGSIVEEQLNDVLGLGSKRLAVADELNEIIASLLNQLTSKAIGAAGRGLRSLSSPSSTGGQSFTDQLSPSSNQAIIDKYFTDSQDNINQGLQITPPDVTFCHNNPYAPECQPGSPPAPTQTQDFCTTNPSDPSCQTQP